MALARLCLKNTLPRPSPSLFHRVRAAGPVGLKFDGFSAPSLSNSSTAAASSSTGGQGGVEKGREDDRKEITVSEGSSLTSPSRRRGGRRGLLPWRNPLNLVPFRLGNGLGNALLQASENLNRLLENWNPRRLLGRTKEDDKCYKLLYEVPGLSKEDLKITVEDGYLVITGEHKDEEEGSDDVDDGWYSRREYGYYYNTCLLLPDDAKVEGIRAEVKDGVLIVTIPRSEEKRRNVKEVEIH